MSNPSPIRYVFENQRYITWFRLTVLRKS